MQQVYECAKNKEVSGEVNSLMNLHKRYVIVQLRPVSVKKTLAKVLDTNMLYKGFRFVSLGEKLYV